MNAIKYIMLIAALLIALLLFQGKYVLSYVPTTSMVPTIEAGSLVISDSSARDYQVGDIAIYDRGDIMVIHRIISINDDGTYTFKGDNNDFPDSQPVERENIQSKYIWHSYALGQLWNIFSSFFSLFLVAFFLFVWIIPWAIRKYGSHGTADGDISSGSGSPLPDSENKESPDDIVHDENDRS